MVLFISSSLTERDHFILLTLVHPDTVSIVMHRRRQKDHSSPHDSSEPVHNLATTRLGVVNNSRQCQKMIGSFACGPVRSGASRSTRAQERLPAGSEASVPKSERTTSREDPVSGRLRTEAKADAARYGSQTSKRKCSMSSPNPLVAHFAGLDWAKQHHYRHSQRWRPERSNRLLFAASDRTSSSLGSGKKAGSPKFCAPY